MRAKQITAMLTGVAIVFMLAGCNDTYMEFDKNLAALGFEYGKSSDSIVYSFVLHPETTEGELKIPFRLMGFPMSTDRIVGVETDKIQSTAVEGKDFVIEPSVLQADSVKGVIKVKVMKTTELDRGELTATIRLRANESFSDPPVNQAKFRVILTNRLAQPTDWPFDEYSKVKHEFVIKVTGVGTDYKNWSGQELIYWTGVLIHELYEYNKNHPGNPLRDENGRLVTF